MKVRRTCRCFFALVVGLIAYLSPARRGSGLDLPSDTPRLDRLNELSRLWTSLPEPLRAQAMEGLSSELRGKLDAAARSGARPGVSRP